MKKFITVFTLFLGLLSAAQAQSIKILIGETQNNVPVKASGPFTVKDLNGGKKYKLTKGGTFKVIRQGKDISAGTVKSSEGIEITLKSKDDFFTFKGNTYNGKLLLLPGSKGVNIIEETDLESYLCGVLPYEMSYSWPIEALKAQAVAARTYTLKTLEDKKMKDFDLYSDVRSQMYKGSVKIYDSVKQAVEETKGEVLKYKDELFYTYYHANCGGHTDSMPGAKDPIKPLQGAKCGYCKESKSARWSTTLTKDTVNNFLKSNGIKGNFKKIKTGAKYKSGRAKTLYIITDKQKVYVGCNDFRISVGSTKFKSCFITDIDGLSFEGKGYGHGAGMCQDGAKGMALDDKNYKEILETFYPSSDLVSI